MSELEVKTERLVRMLAAENLGGVLLNTQRNFAWLSGGGSNGIDLSGENGAGFLFVTAKGKRYVIANNIEIGRLLAEEISAEDFEPVEIGWQAEKDPKVAIDAIKRVTGGDIGSDTGFPETRWIEPSIASCRFELLPSEIDRFRDLGRAAGGALGSVIPRLDIGMTEKQIARIVRDELARDDIFSVVTLVAADDRIAKYRHPIPTDNVWANTLLVVVCARRQGLVASLSRMICAGDIPEDLQRRTEACAKVNAALYAATFVGATSSQLYSAAAAAYAEQDFSDEINKHHQGGACGYRTRDWVAHPDGGEIVRPHQAFAWNPSITGTKTEETAILGAEGLEIITGTDGFPVISSFADGREYFSPGILSLSKGASA
ncbi:MAG TPA: M24 family metallopeptidase [Pyrinomonadaceae bacterium]|nr:M24 family metallopeptidase [Pyrinomonadaceae bacterium]